MRWSQGGGRLPADVRSWHADCDRMVTTILAGSQRRLSIGFLEAREERGQHEVLAPSHTAWLRGDCQEDDEDDRTVQTNMTRGES